mmetsp:Transcript_8391/g.14948  ORF Transcript_8391/g.14948 Transcript_8391/m.14948 type:complete len:104 (+) Transcript_8391:169-480(+)|eukprot:CAMPEP_0184694884 /NCGR_PEP_ID=MMETSP0313-20130426/2702_1 /TAXON_ID=2792 /ORGANISM="Porphyridium aerugineum, Strain SAG 1380-2" /LENGTH=103 /DNA_ID=CAMNT_0027153245 /DNA_START=189 /DNA_END=500 /DNA_ORIENTATION=+
MAEPINKEEQKPALTTNTKEEPGMTKLSPTKRRSKAPVTLTIDCGEQPSAVESPRLGREKTANMTPRSRQRYHSSDRRLGEDDDLGNPPASSLNKEDQSLKQN